MTIEEAIGDLVDEDLEIAKKLVHEIKKIDIVHDAWIEGRHLRVVIRPPKAVDFIKLDFEPFVGNC